MKTKMNLSTILLGVAAVVVSTGLVSCGSDEQSQTFVQIERLARPGINELFAYTNKSHAAFNSISPDLDGSDAAAPVLAEVVTVLQYIDSLSGTPGTPDNTPPVAQVAGGFVPDVMRIDYSATSPVGTEAYSSCLSSRVSLCGGRKLEDDVIKTSYSYLVTGNPAAGLDDGVTYDGSTVSPVNPATHTTCAQAGQGANPAAPGHKCLHGQTVRLGAATFPYLAPPN